MTCSVIPEWLTCQQAALTVTEAISVQLRRDADVAMYRARSDGRSKYVVFDPSMHMDSLARLELENDLRPDLACALHPDR